ncbi:MAG: protein translocase subunit SecD [Muribaculaceae bacterium]|nr:protein translocase subunit SecD [Muribaculaceae bacterium]
MQSKGKLGSILAGIIAVLLVLVCAFYLSFTFVNSSYETEAENYAKLASSNVTGKSADQAYNDAYKAYMDSVGEESVYLGWNLNDVKKWGVNLGLDLKGGMNVILQVDLADLLRQASKVKDDKNFEQALENTIAKVGDKNSEQFVPTFIEEYEVLNPGADLSVVFTPVTSGMSRDQAISALRNEINDVVNTSATQTLRSRIDQFGVVSPNIQVLEGKDGQILLELPGVKDHERVRELLQRQAALEFYTTYRKSEIEGALQQVASLPESTPGLAQYRSMLASWNTNPNYVIIGYVPNVTDMHRVDTLMSQTAVRSILPTDFILRWGVKPETFTDEQGNEHKLGYAAYALRTTNGGAAMDGEVVTNARADFASKGFGGQEVSMQMNSEGARQWADLTGANVNRAVAVVLDDQVYSAPNVNEAITGGRSSITGNFTVDEAKDLANVLKAGKMKARVHIISDMVIGPSLGQQAINAGLVSFVVALILLMIFMIAFYGVIPGLIANLCLIFNLFFTFGILASFQAVLTLSGICGIVLSLGMAVDANVLIFERAKEEMRQGKNSRTALSDGYSNAFSAIFDSNITSIITGFILLKFGTGPIQGFATTLIIGIICSFFTAVYLSRLFFLWIGKTKVMNQITFSTPLSRKMFSNTKINFLGQRRAAGVVVIALIVIFILSLVTRSLNQGIDFSGGRNYVVMLDKPANTEEVRSLLAPEFPDATVSVITIESSNQIRVSTNYKISEEGDAQAVEDEIVTKMYRVLGNNGYIGDITYEQFKASDENHGIVSSQKVGPTVADDMRTDAYIAVTLALIAMFLYILLRFKTIAYSLGALSAVAFTAFSIVGFYSICWGFLPFSMEIDQSFIAAILTVIGYQINDTVVVFDRVRENVGLYPKQPFGETINRSLNATLGRTIMTSASTLLVLLCIFFLGTDAIRSFVFAMIFGVILGTFATIWIATPVAYYVNNARSKKAVKA